MENILAKLVAFHSTTDNRSANNDALDYIDQFVSDCGMYTKQLENNGARALIATSRPHTKTPTVFLAGHVDVVPGPVDLFTLKKDHKNFYGRGVLDMKGTIAVFLKLIEEYKGKLDQFDFGLMITTEEEIGGYDGTQFLLEKGYLPKVCILPDGGLDWQIQVSSKGVLQFKVSTDGHAVHGSQPWMGDNANLKLIRVLHGIQELFPNNAPDTNTVNIGKINGGEAVNQVADAAEALIDIRVVSEEDKKHLTTAIKGICHQHGAKFEVLMEGVGAKFDLNNPYIRPFADLVTEVTGIEVNGSHTFGSSDARFFYALGIPVISLYPTGGGHHATGEWVSIEALDQYKEVVDRYLNGFARISSTAKTPAFSIDTTGVIKVK